MAGKTGTAEYRPDDDKDGQPDRDERGNLPTHAWFTSFAPYDDPEIVVTVFVANGGEGSAVAARSRPGSSDHTSRRIRRQGPKRERRLLSRRFDWYFLALVLALSLFGVVMIASALSGNVVYASYPWRQPAFLGIGLVLLFVAAAVDYRLLESVAYPLYGILLAFVAVISR